MAADVRNKERHHYENYRNFTCMYAVWYRREIVSALLSQFVGSILLAQDTDFMTKNAFQNHSIWCENRARVFSEGISQAALYSGEAQPIYVRRLTKFQKKHSQSHKDT